MTKNSISNPRAPRAAARQGLQQILAPAGLAAGFVLWGYNPAAAQSVAGGFPFTDQFGNTCTTGETIAGANGETICPASAGLSVAISAVGGNTEPLKADGVLKGLGATNPAAGLGSEPGNGFFSPEGTVLVWPDGSVGNGGEGSSLPAPSHLGLYTSGQGGAGAGYGDGFVINERSIASSDTSGTNGGPTPGYTARGGGGGVEGSVLLFPDIELGGNFDYKHLQFDFGDAGSERADFYTLSAYAKYYAQDFYAGVDFNYTFAPASDQAASFNANAISGYVSVGHVFDLINGLYGVNSSMITKGPPPAPEGYDLRLDVNGHGGYFSATSDPFTDNTGFLVGNGNLRFGDIGADAKLEAVIPGSGFLWKPYIGAGIDQRLGQKDTQNLPAQGTNPADTITFFDANTFYSGTIGLDVQLSRTISVGIAGLVSASSDQNIEGGQASIMVRF